MPPFLLKAQLVFFLSILCCIPLQQVLAQAVPVTQILAFTAGDDTQLREIPLYGNSIINHDFNEQKLESYDLDGNPRFVVDYAAGLSLNSNFRSEFSFVGEDDQFDPSVAEVVFSMLDSDDNIILRRINENGDLLFTEVVPDSLNPWARPYFFNDPETQDGFAAIEFFNNRRDSILVYPFSGAAATVRLAGELLDDYPIYEGIPLLLSFGDSLVVGYDATAQEVTRMEPRFGAEELTIISTDFGRDGVLDAYSTIDTLIGGEEATRAIWYDNNGVIYLDTFILGGRVSSFGGFYWTGLLPPDGGYHTANFTQSNSTSSLDITFRSDTGGLIDEDTFSPVFTLSVCFKGTDYLGSIIPGWFVIDTLYNAQTGVAERSIPAGLIYEGQAAMLHTVVGQCNPNLPERVALVYDQPTEQRILFTDADTTVRAELPYQSFAFAFRLDGNVYAQSDLDENGNSARAIYRIGEQISNTQSLVAPLEIALAPNPAHDYFQVLADENLVDSGPLNVRIYTIGGQEVASYPRVANGQSFRTPPAPGMYIVQLIQPATGRRVTKKLVVR